jgi:hypothetical protein
VQVTTFKNNMANQRSGTRDWLPWFSFLGDGIIECVFCQKKYVYVKKRALEHYSYMAKTERIVCTRMPIAVRPPRMTTKNDAHGIIWNLGGIHWGYTTRGSTFFNTVNTYCGECRFRA